jgi:hypothetical protein
MASEQLAPEMTPHEVEMHTGHTASAELSELTSWVYELLDGHRDTARLAADLEGDPQWRAHLEYLRDLQRCGREALARLHAGVRDRSSRAEAT